MAATVAHRIVENLARDPERPAIAFVDGRGEFRWTSRDEFDRRGRAVAASLSAAGAGPGDVVVIVSIDPATCATGVLAALLIGAVPLLVAPPAIQGVNSSLTAIVRDVVRRTRARVLCVPGGFDLAASGLALGGDAPRVLVDLDVIGGADGSFDLTVPDRGPHDVVGLQLTSGTTGFPRIAVWEQARLLAAIDAMLQAMDVGRDDIYLNWTPLYHDMGLVNNFLSCLVRGVPLALMSPLDVVRRPALWLRALDATRATTTWSPNFGYALAAERVRDDEVAGVRLDRVRGFWNAAERVHARTLESFHARFSALGVRRDALRTNFGCVEMIGGVTFSAGFPAIERVDPARLGDQRVAAPPDDGVAEGVQAIVSAGRAAAGARIEVLGEAGEPLPDGHVGAIAIETKARFSGYLDDPVATAEALSGDRVLTSDLGYLRDGEFFWTGRIAERLDLSGRKHDPSELEPALLSVDGLRAGCFAAFGVADEVRGTDALIVLAELDPGAEARADAVAAAVRRAVATGLGWAIDDLLLVRKGTLTKTSSGKRRHLHFKELYLAGRVEALHRSRVGSLPPAGSSADL